MTRFFLGDQKEAAISKDDFISQMHRIGNYKARSKLIKQLIVMAVLGAVDRLPCRMYQPELRYSDFSELADANPHLLNFLAVCILNNVAGSYDKVKHSV